MTKETIMIGGKDYSHIEDITPTYEQLCDMFPQVDSVGFKSFDYEQYDQWVRSLMESGEVYSYERGKEDFFVWEAYQLADEAGCTKLIMENLS